jgi:hypothetical protein
MLDGIMLHGKLGNIVYDIYLDLPPGTVPRADDPRYVGTLNFFHITVGAHGGGHHTNAAFNVTDVVRELQRSNALLAQATVTLIPNGKLASGAAPMIEKINLLEG